MHSRSVGVKMEQLPTKRRRLRFKVQQFSHEELMSAEELKQLQLTLQNSRVDFDAAESDEDCIPEVRAVGNV